MKTNIIIIGIQDCLGCEIIKKKYPDLPYFQLPKVSRGTSGIVLEVKKALGRLGIQLFPVILTDDLQQQVSIKEFDLELYKELEKIYND